MAGKWLKTDFSRKTSISYRKLQKMVMYQSDLNFPVEICWLFCISCKSLYSSYVYSIMQGRAKAEPENATAITRRG